jgi:hypothetical protein
MSSASTPSKPPAGVPTGGNAKYVAVIAILLLGLGGVIWWKKQSSTAQAPAPLPSVPASVASTEPTNPKLEDIPPPPPPEEKPEAGATKIVTGGGGGTTGCEAKCTGSDPGGLAGALQVRASQARRCYNSALAQDPTLKGHVSISVRISSSGNVCSANVATNDMGTPSVAQCAANIFRNGVYPAPRGGCIEANVPLAFVPQNQ